MATLNPTTDALRGMSADGADAPAAATCAHCDLPVPAAVRRPDEPRQFCCGGCRAIWHAIHEAGLGAYYDLRSEVDETAPARVTGRSFGEMDDPAFRARYVRTAEDGTRAVDLMIEGVHCAACLWLLERLPTFAAGVIDARLDFRRHTLHLRWDPTSTTLATVARRLDGLGYTPHAARGRSLDAHRTAEDRRQLIRIAVAGAIAGNVMLAAFALYGGGFHGMAEQHAALFRWTSLGLTLLSVAWPGRVFFRGAWSALRTRTAHMDVPVAVGLGMGTLWSTAATLTGSGDVYFDSITVLIFLLLLGRWIQLRQQRSSFDAVEALFSFTPTRTRRVETAGGIETVREVPIETVAVGDVVEMRRGEAVPVDGVVDRGASTLDRSLLTGEARPIAVTEGDHVEAGTTNLGPLLRVRATATGESTRIARLMRTVERHARQRPPIVRLADRIAGWFVLVVLSLAVATIAGWLLVRPAEAIPNAMALLIITCPCALGLATPMAIVAAIGRGARRHILVKGGEVLERLATPGILLLDKTGTVTEGRMQLRQWIGAEAAGGPDEPWLRAAVAALERHAAHPVAAAFVEGDEVGLEATDVRATDDTIEGLVEGRRIRCGRPASVLPDGDALPAGLRDAEASVAAEGLTPVLVVVDDRPAALAGVGDAVHAGGLEAIDRLRRAGWEVELLSGDHPDAVRTIGASVGIPADRCHGAATPEDKLAHVRRLRASTERPVVMVGDGVNDAAALTAADVGVAVEGGAEASLGAADVYLARRGLDPLVELLLGGRRTVGVIRRNLVVSLGYNVVGASLAMAGFVNPLLAAVLMPMSSITVLTLSLRSRTFEAVEPGRAPSGRSEREGSPAPCP